jgi:sugar-specific transcriptional regulator TrmB
VEPLLDALSELGLNGYESAAYLALLARSGLAPTELAIRAKVPRQRIYDVLESLAHKGLCTSRDTTPRTYYAVTPTLALEGLSQQRAAALEMEREKTARTAQELIAQLLPIFQTGRGQNDPLAYIEVLSEPSRIAARALELARSAQRSVNSCIRRPLILSREQNWRFIQEPLQRGVCYRALYETSASDDAELREWMITFQEWGQQIRLVPVLPVKMNSFDEQAALLSMQDPVGGPPSFTALAIRHPGTVAFLNMAFERLWDQGQPLS